MKHLMKTCPRCGKETFVRSVFGSICGNDECFYEEKEELKNKTMFKEDEIGQTHFCEACEMLARGLVVDKKDHTCGQTHSFLDKDWVSDCCRSSMSEVKNGGISPFKCNYCGKRCQPKQLKNQGLEINKLGKTMEEDIIKELEDVLEQAYDPDLESLNRELVQDFVLEAIEEAREDGITAGMDLVKATYEANKEAWEKEAREEVKEELREKVEKLKRGDGSPQGNIIWKDYDDAISKILKLIN